MPDNHRPLFSLVNAIKHPHLRAFVSDLILIDRSIETIRLYKGVVEYLFEWAQEQELDTDPAKYTTDHLRLFLLSYVERGLAESSRATYLAALKAFYAWLMDQEGAPAENPTARLQRPKVHKRGIRIYSDEDVERIDASLEPRRWHGKSQRQRFQTARDRAIMWTLYCEGFRRAELASMVQMTDNPADARVTIRRKGGDDQEMLLSKRATREILRYLLVRQQFGVGTDEDAVWVQHNGKPLDRFAVERLMRKRAEAVGLDWRGCHAFRRGSAVSHKKAGMDAHDIMNQFGWESDTMLRLYTQHEEKLRAGMNHRKHAPGR